MGEPLAFYGDGKPFLAAEQLGDGLTTTFHPAPSSMVKLGRRICSHTNHSKNLKFNSSNILKK